MGVTYLDSLARPCYFNSTSFHGELTCELPSTKINSKPIGALSEILNSCSCADSESGAALDLGESAIKKVPSKNSHTVATHLSGAAIGVVIVHEPNGRRFNFKNLFTFWKFCGLYDPDESISTNAKASVADLGYLF
ncbi:unannotated protein [freshwater metagenome]|uniref:Unannotated protein n=1 Tax=freshwater metagenome TaxID=449393 RepID=A0A6J6D077_9ZZZZ